MNADSDPLLAAVCGAPIPSAARVLIAVSGGPDSMALLDAMSRSAHGRRPLWTLRVGHVNHGLRGKESDDDEVFVRAQADAYGIAADVMRVDTRETARANGLSIEAAARELRYGALRTMLTQWAGNVIAIGHTADDQLETILLHLLYGAGIRGLSGMVDATDDVIRPLLSVRKSVLLAELHRRSIPFRTDSSNADERYRRNAIRLRAIPPLLALQPALPEMTARMARVIRGDANLLTAIAREVFGRSILHRREQYLGLSRPVLAALEPALRRAVLCLALELVAPQSSPDAEVFALLERLVVQGSTVPIEVRRGITVFSARDRMVMMTTMPGSRIEAPSTLPAPGVVVTPLGDLRIETVVANSSLDDAISVLGPFHALADGETIAWPLQIRARRDGDRIRVERGVGSRKLQDIFVDRKIPRELRDFIPVIADQKGVLWIPGVVRDKRLAEGTADSRTMHLRFVPNEVEYPGKIY